MRQTYKNVYTSNDVKLRMDKKGKFLCQVKVHAINARVEATRTSQHTKETNRGLGVSCSLEVIERRQYIIIIYNGSYITRT